jgi:hypothetical protein
MLVRLDVHPTVIASPRISVRNFSHQPQAVKRRVGIGRDVETELNAVSVLHLGAGQR